MPKLTRKEREDVIGLITDEEKTLIEKANETAKREWAAAEHQLAERLGEADGLIRAAHLRDQIEEMQRELNELEHGHPWRNIVPSDRDYQDAGIRPPHRDRWGGLISYSVPEVFSVKIDNRWALEVFKIVDQRMNILTVQKILAQTGASIRREITLAGTFEDVRQSYQRFYELLRRAGGSEIPPLLSEIIEMPPLLPPPNTETQ